MREDLEENAYLCPQIQFTNLFKAFEIMKTKFFMAALAVAFTFAVSSCGNKKAAETTAAEAVEQVEAAACCQGDSTKACCQGDSTKTCCQADSTKACCGEKACGEK